MSKKYNLAFWDYATHKFMYVASVQPYVFTDDPRKAKKCSERRKERFFRHMKINGSRGPLGLPQYQAITLFNTGQKPTRRKLTRRKPTRKKPTRKEEDA